MADGYLQTDGFDNFVKFTSKRQLKLDNPNTSFPRDPSLGLLAEFNIFPWSWETAPAYDPATQSLIADTVPTLNLGNWTMGWTVISKTAQEQQDYLVTLAEGTFISSIENEFNSIQGLREAKLQLAILTCLIEIRAYQANNATPTPAIDVLATTWGMTKGATVTRVLNKYGPKLSNIVEQFGIREDVLDPI